MPTLPAPLPDPVPASPAKANTWSVLTKVWKTLLVLSFLWALAVALFILHDLRREPPSPPLKQGEVLLVSHNGDFLPVPSGTEDAASSLGYRRATPAEQAVFLSQHAKQVEDEGRASTVLGLVYGTAPLLVVAVGGWWIGWLRKP